MKRKELCLAAKRDKDIELTDFNIKLKKNYIICYDKKEECTPLKCKSCKLFLTEKPKDYKKINDNVLKFFNKLLEAQNDK